MAKEIIKIPAVNITSPKLLGKKIASSNIFKAIKNAVLKK